MKNCPYCKAEIEDNARFCLYCMRSLNEKTAAAPLRKHRPWYLLILGVLLLGAVAVVLLLPKGNSTPISSSAPSGQLLQQSAATESTGTLVQIPDSSPTEDTTVPTEEVILPEDPQPQETPVSTKPVATKPPETVPTTTPTTAPTTEPTTEPTTAPSNDPYANFTKPQVAGTGKGFEYVLAAPWALEDVDYVNTNGDIAISRILNGWDDVVRIPSYIDGRKVVATRLHYPPGATTFYVPSTVKFIGQGDPFLLDWDESPFEYATSLQHLYLEGNNTHFDISLLPEGVTLHCSAKAKNRHGQYYKDIAADYGVIWEEWNG